MKIRRVQKKKIKAPKTNKLKSEIRKALKTSAKYITLFLVISGGSGSAAAEDLKLDLKFEDSLCSEYTGYHIGAVSKHIGMSNQKFNENHQTMGVECGVSAKTSFSWLIYRDSYSEVSGALVLNYEPLQFEINKNKMVKGGASFFVTSKYMPDDTGISRKLFPAAMLTGSLRMGNNLYRLNYAPKVESLGNNVHLIMLQFVKIVD